MVVADLTVALVYNLNVLLAIDDELQRQPHIRIIIRLAPQRSSKTGYTAPSARTSTSTPGSLVDQLYGRRIDVLHQVDFTGKEGAGPRGRVGNAERARLSSRCGKPLLK